MSKGLQKLGIDSNLFEVIFASISCPILLIDRNYLILFANKAAEKLFNDSECSLIKQCCHKATHNLDSPCSSVENILCPLEEAFDKKKRIRVIHNHIYNGHYVLEEITATPFFDKDNNVICVLEEFRDISEFLGLKSSVFPTCAACKKIRTQDGEWITIEEHINNKTGADFSHTFCPECFKEYYPELIKK